MLRNQKQEFDPNEVLHDAQIALELTGYETTVVPPYLLTGRMKGNDGTDIERWYIVVDSNLSDEDRAELLPKARRGARGFIIPCQTNRGKLNEHAKEFDFLVFSPEDLIAEILGVTEIRKSIPDIIQKYINEGTPDMPGKPGSLISHIEYQEQLGFELKYGKEPGKLEMGNQFLRDRLCEIINSSEKAGIAIFGQGGIGKSRLCFETIQKIIEKGPVKPTAKEPFILPISGAAGSEFPDDDLFDSTFRHIGYPLLKAPGKKSLALLGKYFKLILLVDGLDELQGRNGYSSFKDIIESLRNKGAFHVVILTSRHEIAKNTREEEELLNIFLENYLSYEVKPLEDWGAKGIVRDALESSDNMKYEEIFLEFVKECDPAVLELPLFLLHSLSYILSDSSILEELATKRENGHGAWTGLPLFEFVQAHVKFWFNRERYQKQRAASVGGEIQKLLMQLVERKFVYNLDQIPPIQLEEAAIATFPNLASNELRISSFLGRMTGLIKRDFTPSKPYLENMTRRIKRDLAPSEREENYEFISNLIHDYFLARQLSEELFRNDEKEHAVYSLLGGNLLANANVRLDLVVGLLVSEKADLLKEQFSQGTTEKSINDDDLKLAVWDVIKDLKKILKRTQRQFYRKFPPHAHLGANVLRLIVECVASTQKSFTEVVLKAEDVGSFAGMDFSTFRLGDPMKTKGVSLLIFKNLDLDLTTFSGANLTGIRFVNCSLRRSQWCFAEIEENSFDNDSDFKHAIGSNSVRCGSPPTFDLTKFRTTRGLPSTWGPPTESYSIMKMYETDKMKAIPAYDGLLGSDDEGVSGMNPGQVKIASFFMGDKEITCAEYQEFIKNTKYHHWRKNEGIIGADNPYYLFNWNNNQELPSGKPYFFEEEELPGDWCVTYVTYHAAVEFAAFRKHRLPTEAEWELAARIELKDKHILRVNGKITGLSESLDRLLIPRMLEERATEWVLDEFPAHAKLAENSHEWAEALINPLRHRALFPATGFERFSSTSEYRGKNSTNRALRGGYQGTKNKNLPSDKNQPHSRASMFPYAANPDVSFRCAVDWPFIDDNGKCHFSTEDVLKDKIFVQRKK